MRRSRAAIWNRLVLVVIVFDAFAYRLREWERPAMSRVGIVLTFSGELMDLFYP